MHTSRLAAVSGWIRVTALASIASLLASPAQAQSLLDESFGVQKVAGDCLFTEGPVVDAQGTLFFSDGRNNRILQRTVDGQVSEFRKPSGRANGLTLDHEGRLLLCQSSGDGGGRRDTRLEKDGTETVLAATYEGKPFNAPNDICVDPRGLIYFTDPN
ncbi:MAG: SMP-30/gluconolactonase/LRE family protein, partial [Pirellulaceae bacterium]